MMHSYVSSYVVWPRGLCRQMAICLPMPDVDVTSYAWQKGPRQTDDILNYIAVLQYDFFCCMTVQISPKNILRRDSILQSAACLLPPHDGVTFSDFRRRVFPRRCPILPVCDMTYFAVWRVKVFHRMYMRSSLRRAYMSTFTTRFSGLIF